MTTTGGDAQGDWFTIASYDGVSVLAEVKGERVVITGVMVRNPDGVTSAQLREIGLPAVEANLNSTDIRGQLVRQHIGAYGSVAPEIPKLPTSSQLRVRIPKGRKYPDEFYGVVAVLYRRLAANGVPPAPAIAEANGVPVTTVHRWFKEARSRGFLAPARKAGSTG